MTAARGVLQTRQGEVMDEFSDGHAIFTTKPAPPAGLAARLREADDCTGEGMLADAADALDARDAEIAQLTRERNMLNNECRYRADLIARWLAIIKYDDHDGMWYTRGGKDPEEMLRQLMTAARERDKARDALLLLQAGKS